MPDMPAITVKNISKQFDNVEVLRDINLTVKKRRCGEYFGFLWLREIDVAALYELAGAARSGRDLYR